MIQFREIESAFFNYFLQQFREKKSQKRKKFFEIITILVIFPPTNSDLFNIKTLNKKIGKNAIFTNSQLGSNTKKKK